MPIDLAETLRDSLQKFAGRQILLSLRTGAPPGDLGESMREAQLRMKALRGRLLPGTAGGKPDILRRWLAAPGSQSESRRTLWIQSRLCLADAIEEALALPESRGNGATLLASLTHTDGFAAACAAVSSSSDKPRLVGLGLDAEPSRRKPAPAIAKRIAHPEDRAEGLDTLSVWIAKEAVLKSDPSMRTQLSAYALRSHRGADGTGPLQAFGERLDFRIWLEEVGDFRVGLALAYPSHPFAVVQAP